MIESPQLATTREVAKILRVDQSTVTRWLANGQLPGVRLPSGHWRIDLSEGLTVSNSRRGAHPVTRRIR